MSLKTQAVSAWTKRKEADYAARLVEVRKFNLAQKTRAVRALRDVLGYTEGAAKDLPCEVLYKYGESGEVAQVNQFQFEIDGLKILTDFTSCNGEHLVSESSLVVEVFVIDHEEELYGEQLMRFANLEELGRLIEEDEVNRRA